MSELDEILEEWGRATMDVLAEPRISPEDLMKAKTEAKAAIVKLMLDVIGPDVEAHKYGSKAEKAMDKHERFLNDLALCENAQRATQRQAVAKLEDGR